MNIARIATPTKIKNPPWPLNVQVKVKYREWLHPKRGIIKLVDHSHYLFYYVDTNGKESFRQMNTWENRFITICDTQQTWDAYE